MYKRAKFSIVVLIAFVISLLSPSSSFAETPEPPLEVDRVEPVFQTISAEVPSNALPNATPGLGVNWIVNGNAESGVASWKVGPDDFIVSLPYGMADMPTPQDPGPTARGSNFFKSGGTHFEKNAWQTSGIGAAGAMLATGKTRFTLSGFLGGKDTSTDYALLRVYFGFWDPAPSCREISHATIGPVTAADRGNKTGLLERKASGVVPAGTECLSFQLQMIVGAGTAGNTYADNLSFVLDGLPVYLPIVSSPIAQPTNTIPAAPTNLVISETNFTSLNISWEDRSNNETGFIVERVDGMGSNYTEITRVAAGTTSYLNINLSPATMYSYRVKAYNGKGISSAAGVTGSTSTYPSTSPAAPAACWTSGTGSSSTNLGWIDSSNNEEYFIISWKLPEADWYTYPRGIEPNATWITIVGLPSSGTTLFKVVAHNRIGDSTACETSATTTGTSNNLKIQNNTSYPIISLEVDGIEQFPVYPMGLLPGEYYELSLTSGTHTFLATTGFWQSKTDRFFMYSYYVSFVASGSSYTWNIPDITIEALLTQFSPTGTGYWEGYYFDSNANCHTAAFLFSDNLSYKFYVGNSQQATGTYSLTARLPQTYSVKFNAGGQEGWLIETHGQFYMNNGPIGWEQITYVYKPQGYVYNPFCP